jgi:hypothetical protein
MTDADKSHADAAVQLLIWALEEIEKAGNEKARQHARAALEALRQAADQPNSKKKAGWAAAWNASAATTPAGSAKTILTSPTPARTPAPAVPLARHARPATPPPPTRLPKGFEPDGK